MKRIIFILILIIIVLIVGARLTKDLFFSPFHNPTKEDNMKLTTVFKNNENIPSMYTCDGEDKAPVLTVSNIPEDAQELVLIVDDPDAPMGTWVHWLVYDIPVETTVIDEENLPSGVKQGMTDFGRTDWGGPCPPNGRHRYFFKLYALDKKLELPEGIKKLQLENAMRNHIIEKTELIGLYKRR